MDVSTPHLIGAIKVLSHFLEHYLPLANAHVADFIIEDYWKKYVPDGIGLELLQLSDNELAMLPSCSIYRREQGWKYDLLGSDDSLKNSDPIMRKEPWEVVPRKQRLAWDRDQSPNWKHDNLSDFILETRQNRLPFMHVLNDINLMREKWNAETSDKVVIRQFMTAKKSHEVDIMASVCSSLAAYVNAQAVIDIGSGRGYLSSHLNLMYGLSVLAVDSSQVNTQSAQTRGQRLQKHWAGIVRNAKTTNAPELEDPLITGQPQLGDNGGYVRSTETEAPKHSSNYEPSMSEVASNDTVLAKEPVDTVNRTKSGQGFVSITKFVTPDTDLQNLVDTYLGTQPVERSSPGEPKQCPSASGDPLILTGLHTCGNLAPSMLNIFIHGKGKIKAICNVGCCYHHIDEEFIRSPFQNCDSPEPEVFGFPMSTLLRSRCFQLGRNARMLASQTPARMADIGKLSHTSLYYRALLQVILRDLTGAVQQDWQVGKIFSKSKDFHDYVRRALKKLNIDDEGKLTDEVLDGYKEQYGHCERKLSAFVQLRAALAPVIEALILLDRLLYLREKDEVDEAHLVQLFDDVKSPRCYGIIATRR